MRFRTSVSLRRFRWTTASAAKCLFAQSAASGSRTRRISASLCASIFALRNELIGSNARSAISFSTTISSSSAYSSGMVIRRANAPSPARPPRPPSFILGSWWRSCVLGHQNLQGPQGICLAVLAALNEFRSELVRGRRDQPMRPCRPGHRAINSVAGSPAYAPSTATQLRSKPDRQQRLPQLRATGTQGHRAHRELPRHSHLTGPATFTSTNGKTTPLLRDDLRPSPPRPPAVSFARVRRSSRIRRACARARSVSVGCVEAGLTAPRNCIRACSADSGGSRLTRRSDRQLSVSVSVTRRGADRPRTRTLDTPLPFQDLSPAAIASSFLLVSSRAPGIRAFLGIASSSVPFSS